MNSSISKKCLISTGSLILVNASHPYSAENPDMLVTAGPETDGVLMERRAAALLERLMGDIRGWSHIAAVSGWRTEKEQREIWDSSLQKNGEVFTKKYVALPGCSEHQTGLAIDLGLRQENLDFIRPGFPYTGICQVFRKNAARYGFIQRYPSGKEHITGIAHEPWHFRYVGVPHAEIMETLHITLEEYLDLLRQYSAGQKPFMFKAESRMFYITYLHAGDSGPVLPEIKAAHFISGDNNGGIIITTWANGDD